VGDNCFPVWSLVNTQKFLEQVLLPHRGKPHIRTQYIRCDNQRKTVRKVWSVFRDVGQVVAATNFNIILHIRGAREFNSSAEDFRNPYRLKPVEWNLLVADTESDKSQVLRSWKNLPPIHPQSVMWDVLRLGDVFQKWVKSLTISSCADKNVTFELLPVAQYDMVLLKLCNRYSLS
jgi:hypothetical protein